MENDQSEISVFDIVDWLWSFRWLMLACIALALGWAALTWQTTRDPAPSYQITLQIFSSGTPVRETGEVSDILTATLQEHGLNLRSALSANPVVFQTDDSRAVSEAEASVQSLSGLLLEEVIDQRAELERLLPTNESALPMYLKAKFFIEGVQSGLITPIATSITTTQNSGASLARALAIPVIFSGFLFGIVAGGISFFRAWGKYRAARSRP